MSVNRVSPLFAHTITNVTRNQTPTDLRVSVFSLNYLAQIVSSFRFRPAAALSHRVQEGFSFSPKIDSVKQRRFKMANILPKTAKVEPKLSPHVKAAGAFAPKASIKAKVIKAPPPRRAVKTIEVKIEDDPDMRPASRSSISSTETDPRSVALSTRSSSPEPRAATPVAETTKKPTAEELKQENIRIRKELAELCGLDKSAFDRSYITEIVDHFTKHGLKNFDLLDQFFATEAYNHFGPKRLVTVRHLMTKEHLESLMKEVEQDLPKGRDYLSLSKEARSLIFYKNLRRIEDILGVKISRSDLSRASTAEEALNIAPIKKLQSMLSYNITSLERDLILLIIDRFKNTFSSR
jgi:hypothetical protein